MWCDPDLAIAIAIANQDHGLDGYVGEACILILILAIARSWTRWLRRGSLDPDPGFGHSQVHEHMLMGLAHEHMLMGLAHEHMLMGLAQVLGLQVSGYLPKSGWLAISWYPDLAK